ncbi:MAG: hypothetical protein RLZZ385_2042 [Pseudomonadota bacterium]|jgi:5'-3' exonuclease
MTAYLIDASIYIFQAHFSPYVECRDRDGEDVSALFGFAQFLLQFLNRVEADYLAVAMDESLFCGFRHQLCDRYKSNRELPDDNLARQLAACRELSCLLGLPTFASRVYEADDIIGTLAKRIRSTSGSAIAIVSRDKDLAQVLEDENDFVWDYNANRKRHMDDFFAELGIFPRQLPDYLGLVGDAVDRIDGVPGVGPVKGRELLQHFHHMDGIYENLDQVASLPLRGADKLAQRLEQHKAQAYLSRRLATIVNNVTDPTEAFASVEVASLQRQSWCRDALQGFMATQRLDDPTQARLRSLWSAARQSPRGG